MNSPYSPSLSRSSLSAHSSIPPQFLQILTDLINIIGFTGITKRIYWDGVYQICLLQVLYRASALLQAL